MRHLARPGMTIKWNVFNACCLVAVMIALASSSASAAEIRVMAAGSLKGAFTTIFADYTKQYGSSFTPVWGPSGVLRERLQNGAAFDIFASAALPHAQALTEAGVSGPSVLFARNALCIVTDAGTALDSGNLIETLLKPDTKIGTSTPVSDPAGDYTWEMFHRIDAQRPGTFKTLSEKAQQLFGSATTTTPVNGRPRLLVALDDHQIDLFIYYCSGAREIVKASLNYKLVELPSELSVGPEYGLTVSRKASPGAADFAMYLLSPQGQASLKAFGSIPVALPAAP
ncbi:MAG: Molybdenum transporter molybdate-binding protein [Bradyrhizobium sp.]|nr:Molybdenum transporter molybdate-binding protein [Bradyrhizobium sp.]